MNQLILGDNLEILKTDAKGLREIRFVAVGVSEAGVEFYAWDFKAPPSLPEGEEQSQKSSLMSFKPDVLLDKTGIQSWKFQPGQHTVAVKVVDDDGLENVEVIRVNVNGW